MADGDLAARVREFLAPYLLVPPEAVTPEFDILKGTGMYGLDLGELVEAFGAAFRVNLDGYRWNHHTGPEGCNPLWLADTPWWSKKNYVPIRLADLVESARRGRWCVRYPEAGRGR